MANTQVQVEVADWVRREWMLHEFGQHFGREAVALTASDNILVPVVPGDFALESTKHIGKTIQDVKDHYNPALIFNAHNGNQGAKRRERRAGRSALPRRLVL